MRRFLVMLLSLLCIVLPLQANAGIAVAGKHCPHMQDMKISSAMTSSKQHDCCNDAATFAKTGQLCKSGQQCSPSLSYMLSPAMVHIAFNTNAPQQPTIAVRAHTGPPPAVWRPPTLV